MRRIFLTTEIDRYIGWPGQALSSKVGEIKIKSLRKKSEEALGKNFDIGAFHQAILQNGLYHSPNLKRKLMPILRRHWLRNRFSVKLNRNSIEHALCFLKRAIFISCSLLNREILLDW